jgi:hypothetical protein
VFDNGGGELVGLGDGWLLSVRDVASGLSRAAGLIDCSGRRIGATVRPPVDGGGEPVEFGETVIGGAPVGDALTVAGGGVTTISVGGELREL